MKYIKNSKNWLVGAGLMAQDYYRVLVELGIQPRVITRSTESAERFFVATGHVADDNGVDAALLKWGAPERAIVAVNVECLAEVAMQLIDAGTSRILLEKPGALDRYEISKLDKMARSRGAQVFIGYNRRFYESTRMARRMLVEDGGPTSCTFEFTEWAHTIEPLSIDPRVKQHWVMGNSSHVIDLAFYLCGWPNDWSNFHHGSMPWHKSAARFCGSGITKQGVLFTYFADWEAPGRWGVEVMTRKRRFIFRPLERLQVMSLGSVYSEFVDIDDALDKDFKPGLYRQTASFLHGDDAETCTLAQQVKNFDIYRRIAGYP